MMLTFLSASLSSLVIRLIAPVASERSSFCVLKKSQELILSWIKIAIPENIRPRSVITMMLSIKEKPFFMLVIGPDDRELKRAPQSGMTDQNGDFFIISRSGDAGVEICGSGVVETDLKSVLIQVAG